MADEDMQQRMKHATETAVALMTAMQSGNAAVLNGQIVATVEWIGLDPKSNEAARLALQLNQSTHLTTLCVELLAKAAGMTVPEASQRLAALVTQYNIDNG